MRGRVLVVVAAVLAALAMGGVAVGAVGPAGGAAAPEAGREVPEAASAAQEPASAAQEPASVAQEPASVAQEPPSAVGEDPPAVPDSRAAPPAQPDEAAGFGAVRSARARAFGACMREARGDADARAACADLRPGPAHLDPAHPGRAAGRADADTGVDPPGERGDGGGFGVQRSAGARAFGACMREHAGDTEARAACAHRQPGPAHGSPGHPGRGPGARDG